MVLATGALAKVNDNVGLPRTGMGPQDTLTQARSYMGKIRGINGRVLVLQDQARRKRDILKLECVNDKHTQLRGHIAVADGAMLSLDGALARGDEGAQQHELTRMTIIYEKAVVLGTEAENCIGEDASYVGATEVEVEIDPNIPPEDPTEAALPLPDVTRPPEASPFV
jgi:hypothetical protein